MKMNQEQNNLNPNNFNTQGNNGIPNNQSFNNTSLNQQSVNVDSNIQPNNQVNTGLQSNTNYQQINPQSQPTPSYQQQVNVQQPTNVNTSVNNKPQQKNKLGLIIGIVIAIVIIISVLIVLMFSKLSNNSNNSNNPTIQDNEKELTFEEKLKKLEESNASEEEILNLFFENIEITTTKVNENQYLISLTNKTPYDLYKFKINWNLVKDGKVQRIPNNIAMDRSTVFYYVYSGETVYAIYNYSILDTKSGTFVNLDIDEIKMASKSYKSYHQAEEDSYKNIIVSNIRYDKDKGVIYTIENPYDTQKYPTVNVLYYKDDKVIYVEKRTQYSLYANTTLTDYEFSKSSLTEKYELVKFDFDYINVVIDNSKE